jgi:hypothetical protein
MLWILAPLLLSQTTPPLPPQFPAKVEWADELEARRRLFAACDAARNGVGFRCAWSVTPLASNARNAPPVLSGIETLRYQPKENKLALDLEQGVPGSRKIYRAISDGETLLGVRFIERGKEPAIREATPVYLSDANNQLTRALAALKFDGLGEEFFRARSARTPR